MRVTAARWPVSVVISAPVAALRTTTSAPTADATRWPSLETQPPEWGDVNVRSHTLWTAKRGGEPSGNTRTETGGGGGGMHEAPIVTFTVR